MVHASFDVKLTPTGVLQLLENSATKNIFLHTDKKIARFGADLAEAIQQEEFQTEKLDKDQLDAAVEAIDNDRNLFPILLTEVNEQYFENPKYIHIKEKSQVLIEMLKKKIKQDKQSNTTSSNKAKRMINFDYFKKLFK